MSAPIILWFRQDLRISDNLALLHAAGSGHPVIPVYVFDPGHYGNRPWGGASQWWLHESLCALSGALEKLGSRLILRRGETVSVLQSLMQEVGAAGIYFSRAYEPAAVNLEGRLNRWCGRQGLECKRFRGFLLQEPEQLRTQNGQPFKVFTPFWKACQRQLDLAPPAAPPSQLPAPQVWPSTETLPAWALQPRQPDWAAGFRASWQPGEMGAQRRLETFLVSSASGYALARDYPGQDGTSRLSPHLHFGEISPAQIFHGANTYLSMHGGATSGIESFLREVAWREFCYHLLAHWPLMPEQNFRAEFNEFPWQDDPALLQAWQRGQTGYPIVDAGMRQLWHCGWMHNRVRMIVASFLVKDLLIPWQRGESWFWDTLVDADLANNAAGWQWVAGSGADAAPYFRVFNPVTQSSKFDPDGDYIRRWVPELAGLGSAHIHQPWAAPGDVLRSAGVILGENYPRPLVDHGLARERALAGYAAVKQAGRKAGS